MSPTGPTQRVQCRIYARIMLSWKRQHHIFVHLSKTVHPYDGGYVDGQYEWLQGGGDRNVWGGVVVFILVVARQVIRPPPVFLSSHTPT